LDLTNQEKPRNSFTSSLDMTLTDEEKWRLRRKSMASSMDLSSVVISVTESSTILDSFKALMKKKDSGESKDQTPKNANTLVNEYSFDANDDGFDESLISSSLPNEQLVPTQISVDHFIIPAIFVRKSGTSDITMDIEATRLMIESTLTSSDEDLTFSSTINNSIISEADAAAIAREKNFKDKSPVVSGSGGSEGFDAGKMIAQQLSTLADEIEERARKKDGRHPLRGILVRFVGDVPDPTRCRIRQRQPDPLVVAPPIPSRVSCYLDDGQHQESRQQGQGKAEAFVDVDVALDRVDHTGRNVRRIR